MSILDFEAKKKQRAEQAVKPVAPPRPVQRTAVHRGPLWMTSAWGREVTFVALPDVAMVIRIPGGFATKQ